jgi:beta-fructofuranosidase
VNEHINLLLEANRNIEIAKNQVSLNYWKLKYHITPQANWMNDPNGFVYYKGEYHVFFQHYPYSPKWGPMHWGHFKSTDLVHWEPLPIALAPSESYDNDGCFSGSAIEKDGSLYLLYTGNVWTGKNKDEELKQTQALAVSKDGIHFEKLKNNPVISGPPEGNFHPYHFRDPKVWKHGDRYYCVIGSKTKDNKGQALLYRSNDLLSWEFVNVIARAKGNMGFMWECPDVFSLDGKDVLMISPQGIEPEGMYYQNLSQSGYVLGELDYEQGNLKHDDFHLLDYGFDFYAPQSMLDDKGRRIIIAWMEMWESKMPTQNYGWTGSMTLPRVLELKDNKIYTTPVPELKKLRKNDQLFENVVIKDSFEFEGVSGDCLEMVMAIAPMKANRFGINVRSNKDKNERTVVEYDCIKHILSLDRERSGQGDGGIRSAEVQLLNQELKLQIFIDHSSIEIFINNGEKVMTARIYPSEDSKGIQFFSDDYINIKHLQKWDIKTAE